VSATDRRMRNRTSMAGEGTIQPAESRPDDGESGLNETPASSMMPANPLAPSLIRRQ
jgi:hypothetical protein